MFKLTKPVLKQYRGLRYKPEARREFSMIPFGAFVWEDEHPGGKCMLPRVDDQSTMSILQLVAARTALWMSGQVPDDLQHIWDEARSALPNWPGFARLSISSEDQEIIRANLVEMDSIQAALCEDAEEVSMSDISTGVTQITATYNLKKLIDKNDDDDV